MAVTQSWMSDQRVQVVHSSVPGAKNLWMSESHVTPTPTPPHPLLSIQEEEHCNKYQQYLPSCSVGIAYWLLSV